MKIYLVLTAGLLSTHCLSQVDLNEARLKVITSRTLPTSVNTGFLTSNSFTKLEANNNGTKATAAVAYSIGKSIINLNVEQPVSSTERVQPITLDGLSNNASISLGFQSIFSSEDFEFDQNANVNEYAERESGTTIKQSINDRTSAAGIKLSYQNRKLMQLARYDLSKWKFYVGGKIGVVRQDFDYLVDEINFLEKQESKSALKASFTVGALFTHGALSATFTHYDGFEGGNIFKYYFPINNTTVLKERELALGVPAHKTEQRVRLEFMSIGNSGQGNVLRINPNLNVSLQKKQASFDFPIFFLSQKADDKTPNLNGGIFGSYTTNRDFKFSSDKASWGLGMFIGGSINDLF